MSVRITCINKSGGHHENPHEAISHYGWIENGQSKKTDRQTMVNWVKQGNTAYVQDSYGNQANCQVRTSSHGTEFLQTYADNKPTDNLLSLPECK
jgi:hypothetical protein